MEAREYYIRYRIYVNYSREAKKDYPRRLCKNLLNLHNNLQTTTPIPPKKGVVVGKTFIPKNLKHINPKYYSYIAHISDYFECLTLWERVIVKGSIEPLNTFTVYGYKPDILLAYHYITKVIDSLNAMRFNITQEYRRIKINKRRRGTNKRENETATTKSSKFFYKSLGRIELITKEILEKRINTPEYEKKIQSIFKTLDTKKKLNYRAYNYKGSPNLSHCKSRRDRFQNNRFITVNF